MLLCKILNAVQILIDHFIIPVRDKNGILYFLLLLSSDM